MSDPAPAAAKPVETLVVDTNLFIKGLPVSHISSTFVTVPDVVHELRSRAAKDRFAELQLTHGIELLQPDAESIQAVRNFAKKTGDFASLALADMKVVALAFMLEKRANGMERLRLEPMGSQPDISDRKLLEGAQVAGAKSELANVDEEEEDEEVETSEHVEEDEEVEEYHSAEDESLDTSEPVDDELTETLENMTLGETGDLVLQKVTIDDLDEEFEDDIEDETEDKDTDNKDTEDKESDDGWQVAGAKPKRHIVPRVDEFFNGGWITPSNVKQRQAADAMGMKEARAQPTLEPMRVACVTSDFAMQNVMLKMGINLVTPDGVLVRQLRTWVLRCHACSALTGDMERQFCASCGHATLRRCSVTTGHDGRLNVHLKANYRNNLRGTVYALPRAKGGKHTVRDVITREDDRAYVNAMRYKKRVDAKANKGMGMHALDDPDFVPELLLGNQLSHANGYGVATDARGMPMVARNRRNPNVVRNTGNRKKKSQK
ncbi:20S-pre-rRNA D-site endonuclease nob1 [Coemansia sp. RSA 2440]|nr:20S-pre-rRNA D-site endonuclease nob1 [Coemansia sp. RSA 637]KAJ2439605.1 20S-pre-rRNA D-site endonuclease nob1 [Coemansia sp. RSA 2440]KAJ2555818.1 20S-pre-rRNA D-site endonuclease nob1 [Coemansia sp. RSA 1878]